MQQPGRLSPLRPGCLWRQQATGSSDPHTQADTEAHKRFAASLTAGGYKVKQLSFTLETTPRNLLKKQTPKCFGQLLATRDLSSLEWILSSGLKFLFLSHQASPSSTKYELYWMPSTNFRPRNSLYSKRSEERS